MSRSPHEFPTPADACRRLVELYVEAQNLAGLLAGTRRESERVTGLLATALQDGETRRVLVEGVRDLAALHPDRWTVHMVELTLYKGGVTAEVTAIDESDRLEWPSPQPPSAAAPIPSRPPRQVGEHAVEVGGDGDPLGPAPSEDEIAMAAMARAFDPGDSSGHGGDLPPGYRPGDYIRGAIAKDLIFKDLPGTVRDLDDEVA